MEESNSVSNFQQDRFETVCVEVIFEVLSSAILFTGSYYTYRGIEIRHPVYAVLFCDLIVALASSLINGVIFPFVSTYRYTSLANGSNVLCLIFHSCCWCILSIQRYLYITKKTWLEQKFPDPSRLLKASLLSLIVLVTFNMGSGLGIVIYYGYPKVKVMEMSLEHKIPCVIVLLCNYVVMLLISCWCYAEILRLRGKFGQNSVNFIDESNSSQVDAPGIFIVENFNRENSAHENFELRNFAAIQSQSLLKKQQAEVDSAVLSLKTNASYFLFLIVLFLSVALLSSDVLAIMFSILTKLAPVLTCIFNFVKIRTLMLIFLEESFTILVFYKNKFFC
jgi:hypothetical protein